MKRLSTTLIAAATLCFLGTALAAPAPFTPDEPIAEGQHELYIRDLDRAIDRSPVVGPGLPQPIYPRPEEDLGMSSVKAGPVSIGSTAGATGGAIVGPRGGGSVGTAKQQGDREIRRVIRRLN
ncbi:MAG: hypothetical protein GY716_11230 [bacterium]|nr:hypothetical protein [bacterium]